MLLDGGNPPNNETLAHICCTIDLFAGLADLQNILHCMCVRLCLYGLFKLHNIEHSNRCFLSIHSDEVESIGWLVGWNPTAYRGSELMILFSDIVATRTIQQRYCILGANNTHVTTAIPSIHFPRTLFSFSHCFCLQDFRLHVKCYYDTHISKLTVFFIILHVSQIRARARATVEYNEKSAYMVGE